MKIGIGSDHGGFLLKQEIISYFKNTDIEIIDYGTNSLDSCDYPIFAQKVCKAYLAKEIEYGILVCTTGIGMSICANKFEELLLLIISIQQALLVVIIIVMSFVLVLNSLTQMMQSNL